MAEKESEMVNVPSKVFYQGEPGADNFERAIIMNFYNGSIELDQQDLPRILIGEDHLESFIKSLRKGYKEAQLLRS